MTVYATAKVMETKEPDSLIPTSHFSLSISPFRFLCKRERKMGLDRNYSQASGKSK